MVYHMVTSYQWRDVTGRPPTATGETVTVIPISYVLTAIFGFIPQFKHSLQSIVHILQCIGWSEPTCKSQNKPKESDENTAKDISSPTLYGPHLSILKNIAFALGCVGRMAELLDRGDKLCRPDDLIRIGRQVTGSADVPYKRICAATLNVEDHSFVC